MAQAGLSPTSGLTSFTGLTDTDAGSTGSFLALVDGSSLLLLVDGSSYLTLA